ncbi:MAG: glucokinase [bacterium]|nr:glucokinase [bacterium]
MIIAGDVGATKTILGIFRLKAGVIDTLNKKLYQNSNYVNFESVIKDFLSETNYKINMACFGVAGPIMLGKTKITNLNWTIDENNIKKSLNISNVKILNDLEATAYALPHLKESEIYTLNLGEKNHNGNISIIAPGTGLGESFLGWGKNRYFIYPSQGGHTDFAPTNSIEVELLNYLLTQLNHVSYETVCSGKGISNIYYFLRNSDKYKEPDWLTKQINENSNIDITPIIIDAALNKKCDICTAALDIFISILGAEAGNLTLKTLSTAGLYVCGGIPPRILSILKNGQFMNSFKQKGKMKELISKIPVYIVLNHESALIGAASYGLKKMQFIKSF